MNQMYLDDRQSLAELASRMPHDQLAEWNAMGHLRIEPGFADRVFILYQCQGRDSRNVQRPPNIVATFRVVDFHMDSSEGARMRVLHQEENKMATIGHVPMKLGTWPIYLALPPKMTVKWDGRLVKGSVVRSLSFAIFVKAANKADFFSKDNYYLESPNSLRMLYPHLDLKLEL